MAEQKVELRQVRDFSQNLSDTFLFIKQNFKPLLLSFLTIAGVFLLAAAIVNGINQGEMGGNMFREFMEDARRGAAGRSDTSPFQFINSTYFIGLTLTWMGMTAMHVVITAYMKLYEEKHNEPVTTQEVWEVFKKYYLKVLLYSLPLYLLIGVGMVLCILPGIYLSIVLLPFSSIIIVEDVSFGTAFSRCFAIIKENFWVSFGIYIIVYLIYTLSASIVSAVVGIITGAISYFTTKDFGTAVGIFTGIAQAFTFVFAIVFYVSVVLNYFSLAEKLDGTGLLKRLDTLGRPGSDFNNVEEQY